MLLLMMLIYVTIIIILLLMYFQNRPAGDQRGPRGRPGARGHHVGDPCSILKRKLRQIKNVKMRLSQIAFTAILKVSYAAEIPAMKQPTKPL